MILLEEDLLSIPPKLFISNNGTVTYSFSPQDYHWSFEVHFDGALGGSVSWVSGSWFQLGL